MLQFGLAFALALALAHNIGVHPSDLTPAWVLNTRKELMLRLPLRSGGATAGVTVAGTQQAAAVAAAHRPAHMNGLQMARQVVRTEGVAGLYRGFGMSVATFVPSSGIWWGSYGAYQKLMWHQVLCLSLNSGHCKDGAENASYSHPANID